MSQHFANAIVNIETEFTQEMDKLRSLCFPGNNATNSSGDEFDHKSQHIVIRIENKIAAYGRLTPGPNAVFQTWTDNKADIPIGENVIDLGRCLVSPDYRGLNLIEPIILTALDYADKENYDYVVGAFRLGRKLFDSAQSWGFNKSGNPVYDQEPNGNKVLIQPVVCEIKHARNLWPDLLQTNVTLLQEKGYLLQFR